MSPSGTHAVEHDITVDAPAHEVYRLIAQVENWPRIFPPTIFVEHTERHEREERIHIWATANGEAKNWVSRRTLAPETLRIDFRQEISSPPVAAMGGTWLIEPLTATTSKVRLLHDYRAVDDDPEGLKWIEQALERNSRSELEALRSNVALAQATQDLTFSFSDSVEINGPAERAYDFVNDAHLWAERLPHVVRVDFSEPAPGLQTLEMDTRANDGTTHTTKSYRVAFPHHKIAYKQITLPALMLLHTGIWTFEEHHATATATSQHTVVLNTANITRILGPDATAADARAYVHNALSTNSRVTLQHAKHHAETTP